jgi:hypothetical protein
MTAYQISLCMNLLWRINFNNFYSFSRINFHCSQYGKKERWGGGGAQPLASLWVSIHTPTHNFKLKIYSGCEENYFTVKCRVNFLPAGMSTNAHSEPFLYKSVFFINMLHFHLQGSDLILSQWCRVFILKLTVSQLVKKLPPFHKTKWFTTMSQQPVVKYHLLHTLIPQGFPIKIL